MQRKICGKSSTRARDSRNSEQEPVERDYEALEDEMQAYNSDYLFKHGHLRMGDADRYDKYSMRSCRHRS